MTGTAASTTPEGALPELVLPAGNVSKLRFALAYGADAVYVGAAGFSMRPDEASFTAAPLRHGVQAAHAAGKRIYVGINCLMSQGDLEPLGQWLEETRDLAMDAVIVADLGALALVRELRPQLPVHISTQLSTANTHAAALLARLGASRVVLARECPLADAAVIARDGAVETEVFVHGAMCVAVSGRCLLSAHLCGASGSKGACKHSCRWEWQLVEQKRPGEAVPVFETDRGTVLLGSTDLCLIEHLPAVLDSGVHALKVEGRMKSEHYVATVARTYRAALDTWAADPEGYRFDPAWMPALEAVSHRPFATGFAFGYPQDRPAALQTHNHPVSTHLVNGYIDAVDDVSHAVTVKNPFDRGDRLEWIAPGQESGEVTVETIIGPDGEPAARAHCGTSVRVRFAEAGALPPLTILRRQKHA